MHDRTFRAPIHFVAHGPMIFPKDIVVLIGRRRIDEQKRPLKIIHQLLVRQGLQIVEQLMIESLRLIGVAARVQKDERLSNFDMSRLPGVDLLHDNDTDRQQQQHHQQHNSILSKKRHSRYLVRTRVCLKD